ncbi:MULTISPECIES: poly-gamma-glutamate system protein [unclassified Moorena]|uniref:poly-gamma-glutamate system protein n=1 Tax=unclassified Moorena TaxID=2683338 RepID=UPI0013CA3723|nr:MULTISPECIES: poly-gamma-glutamate system protein [unclassified Moorena]NEO18610.1 poly-gamma-glutamate system protein [Moorena sp. SIO4A5]NEP23216.1 poly-gamma-glutamate system protein [Moorena sp. SIO3I6]NEQ56430.1 poly-gamma-glutamate system protein [Moorena sp. SIO4A1]
MKRLYWQSEKQTWKIILTVAIVALIGLMAVENISVKAGETEIKAAQIMQAGMETIKEYRQKEVGEQYYDQYDADKLNKFIESGMIGVLSSPITTMVVAPTAKVATINPNWAALMVDLYIKAGVKNGDTIAASFSGSYPALNLAVMAAAEAMDIKVIAISSVGSSSWGSNLPNLAWLDMERILNEKQIISNRSVAASRGGLEDLGLGLEAQAVQMMEEIIKRNKMYYIYEIDRRQNIDHRMSIYSQYSDSDTIKLYVNVGGGKISVGDDTKERIFQAGLNKNMRIKPGTSDSLMKRFAESGMPVIQMRHMTELCKRLNMPCDIEEIPLVSEVKIFSHYNKFLVIAVFTVITALLLLLVKERQGTIILNSAETNLAEKDLPVA